MIDRMTLKPDVRMKERDSTCQRTKIPFPKSLASVLRSSANGRHESDCDVSGATRSPWLLVQTIGMSRSQRTTGWHITSGTEAWKATPTGNGDSLLQCFVFQKFSGRGAVANYAELATAGVWVGWQILPGSTRCTTKNPLFRWV